MLDAEKTYRKLLTLRSPNPKAYLTARRVFGKGGRLLEGASVFGTESKVIGDNKKLLKELGVVYVALNDFQHAPQYFLRIRDMELSDKDC